MSSNILYRITGTVAEPLEHKREHALIRGWQKRKSHADRDALIANYLLYTVKTARRIYSWLREDDALMLAHDAIFDAIDRFDLKRKEVRLCNLIPFSVRICYKKFSRRDQLVRCPVKERRNGATLFVSFDAVTADNSAEDHGRDQYENGRIRAETAPECDIDSILEPEQHASETVDRERQQVAVLAAMKKLSAAEREILNDCFFDGHGLADIGRMRGITREAVRQRRNAALNKLRLLIADVDCFKA